MKRNTLLLLTLIAIGTGGCKKYNHLSQPTITSSPNKKWIVTTVAGSGLAHYADGPALLAEFRAPLDVAIAEDGAIFVADAINHRIRKIADGQVITFVGIGSQDTTSGNASVAGFAFPSYIVFDKLGDLYTLDVEDPRVRKVSPAAFVSVVAGNGMNGFADGRSDSAQFGKECAGIAMDEQGNIYVSDWKSRRIRQVSVAGKVTTIAGNGQAGFINGDASVAQFFNPGGIVVDKQGNVFVADWNRVRKISTSGNVSTFAGSESAGFRDGPVEQALFSDIQDLVMDRQGNIYLSDDNRIRRINPQGEVSTIAGSTAGFQDGDASTAKFNGPVGLGIDKQGNIYVADDHNNRIRKISFE